MQGKGDDGSPVYERLRSIYDLASSPSATNAQWRGACDALSVATPQLLDLVEAVGLRLGARCWSREGKIEDSACLCSGEYMIKCPCTISDNRVAAMYKILAKVR